MTTKRRMPVNVLQGLPPAQGKDPVLDGLVGGAAPTPPPKRPQTPRAPRTAAIPLAPAPAAAAVLAPPSAPASADTRRWQEARRLRRARAAVHSHALWSATAGLVPVPAAAGVLLLAIQAGLARRLAADYGLPLRRQTWRCLAAGLTATAACLAVSPAAAWVLRAFSLPAGARSVVAFALAGAAATYLAGRTFVQDAEAGGTLLGLDPDAMRDFFRRLFAGAPRPD